MAPRWKTIATAGWSFGFGCLMMVGVSAVQERTAAPPPLIPFQGILTTPAGAPRGGTVPSIFSLYSQPVGGVPVWVQLQPVDADAQGRYVVLLGATTALPVELFTTALWLGVQPEGQAELPRVPLTSSK